MKDLFGNEVSETTPKPRPRAYPAMPGSGPDGETCKFWTNKPVESAKDFIRDHLGIECEKREIRID